ncbi:MAG TPA: hypothetical protein VLC54_11305, partial [Anaeromyxobacter sp.]|nr:hypothetical protein [Anaeromyxobacter sp.]
MAEATKDPSAPSSASGTRSGAGFELRLERGGAFVRLADQPIAPGVRLDALTLELPDVRFPFDVGKGSGQFRHRLSDLSELAIAIEPGVADAALASAGLAAFGVEEARIAFRAGTAEIAARLSGGPAFTLVAGLLPEGDQGVALVFHSPRIYGPAPIPAALLPHLARGVVDALGADALPREPVPFLLRRILAPRGWKLPRTAGVPLARAEIAEGVVRLAWLRGAAGPAAVSPDPDLLAAEEGARTFREPEARLAAGDAAGARDGYLAAGAAASAHPFAAERLLSLLAAEDRFHDEALDLAAEWLSRRPGFLPALAAEASIRLARGEPVKAARALAALAAGAADRGETFSALAAAEAVLALPGAAREEAVRAAELALSVRRDHVPALRALRAHAAAAGDREGLLRALRRLVAHDPEDAEKARAHAELGTLLLEADPPAARLHLDHALRLAPEDPAALAALARACRAAEEPLRAVRVLERLCAAQLARGDRAAAAAAATEAGTLWEERLLHPENALLRHREACELAPSPQAHAHAASAAEAAGQWAEAAEHHAAVVAALPPSTPGASELLVRTRVALADVAEARLADPPAAAAHLEAATALAPERADLLRRLAALHAATGREDGALAALDRLAPLLPSGPERASVLAGAGQAAAALGRTADARSRFAAALAADERCGPALDGLARLAAARGDAAAEREALVRLATLATSAAEAARLHDRLAGACERAGDLVGALRAAAAARAADPGPARLDALLALARRAEDLPLVSALLAERAAAAAAAGDGPGAAAAWLDRARVLGPVDPAGARAALAEARAAAPGDASVLRAQADHAELAGDAPLALGCLRALLAGAPADAPDLEVRASRAALATGDATAARAHAERALELGAAGATELACAVLDRPGDDAARAVLLERLGRFLEAADLHARAGAAGRERAALERAAEDPAAAAAALARLAGLREAEGDRAGAGAALLGLARLTPGAEGARVALRAHDLSADPAALDV